MSMSTDFWNFVWSQKENKYIAKQFFEFVSEMLGRNKWRILALNILWIYEIILKLECNVNTVCYSSNHRFIILLL